MKRIVSKDVARVLSEAEKSIQYWFAVRKEIASVESSVVGSWMPIRYLFMSHLHAVLEKVV